MKTAIPDEDEEEEEETAAATGAGFDFFANFKGFDFGAALANLVPPENPVMPSVKLAKITSEGEITLAFTKDMIVPPLSVI